jgi:hypothetical protein
MVNAFTHSNAQTLFEEVMTLERIIFFYKRFGPIVNSKAI